MHETAPFTVDTFLPYMRDSGLLVKQVIRANNGKLLIQSLDVERLFARPQDAWLPTALNLTDMHMFAATGYDEAAMRMGDAA